MEFPFYQVQKEQEFLLAGLLAYIVDDGCISNGIEIYGSNKKVMDSLGEITSRLGYENSGVKLKAKRGYRTHLSDHFRLRLTHAGCKKLFSDMEELREKFPTCYLAQKQEKFEKMVAAWTRNPLAAAVA